MEKPVGKKANYKIISLIIYISFIVTGISAIALNLNLVDLWLDDVFGMIKSEIIKQFFYGALGATIFSSFYMSDDVELNELESLKDKPDFTILRYPTKEDIHLYIQRIISSGVLAVFGVFVIIVGFGYLDIDLENINLKHKILFCLVSLMIGLFQGKFYDKLKSVFEKIFKGDNK